VRIRRILKAGHAVEAPGYVIGFVPQKGGLDGTPRKGSSPCDSSLTDYQFQMNFSSPATKAEWSFSAGQAYPGHALVCLIFWD